VKVKLCMSRSCATFTVDDLAAGDSLTNDVVSCGKFKWYPVIIEVLQQAPNNRLPVKKLRKKVS